MTSHSKHSESQRGRAKGPRRSNDSTGSFSTVFRREIGWATGTSRDREKTPSHLWTARLRCFHEAEMSFLALLSAEPTLSAGAAKNTIFRGRQAAHWSRA